MLAVVTTDDWTEKKGRDDPDTTASEMAKLGSVDHPLGSPRQVKPDSSHGCPQNGGPVPWASCPTLSPRRERLSWSTHRHHQHVDTQVKLAACQARGEWIGITNTDGESSAELGLGEMAVDRPMWIPVKPQEVPRACLAQSGWGLQVGGTAWTEFQRGQRGLCPRAECKDTRLVRSAGARLCVVLGSCSSNHGKPLRDVWPPWWLCVE